MGAQQGLMYLLLMGCSIGAVGQENNMVVVTGQIFSGSGMDYGGKADLTFAVGSLHNEIVLGQENSIIPNVVIQMDYGTPLTDYNLPEEVDVLIYPNPFVDRVTVQRNLGDQDTKTMYYQLYDVAGNKLNTGSITYEGEEITLSTLSVGMYFLVIYQQGEEIETFKLIKSNM
tara:strand:+ start:9152 stop:9667 length:516 start_codon:yes stop_codon:yes gene_type:complete